MADDQPKAKSPEANSKEEHVATPPDADPQQDSTPPETEAAANPPANEDPAAPADTLPSGEEQPEEEAATEPADTEAEVPAVATPAEGETTDAEESVKAEGAPPAAEQEQEEGKPVEQEDGEPVEQEDGKPEEHEDGKPGEQEDGKSVEQETGNGEAQPAEGAEEQSVEGAEEQAADGATEQAVEGAEEQAVEGAEEQAPEGTEEKGADGSEPSAAGEAEPKPDGEKGSDHSSTKGSVASHGAEEDAEKGSKESDKAETPKEATPKEATPKEGTPKEESLKEESPSGSIPRAGSPAAVGMEASGEPDSSVRSKTPTISVDAGKDDEAQPEEDYISAVQVPELTREEVVAQYHQVVTEREVTLQQNYQLQHKLAEHFRKKRSEESRQEIDKNAADSEQRYLKYIAQLEELRSQDTMERETYKLQIEEMKERCQGKQSLVETEQNSYMDFQRQVARNSLNSRSGKQIPIKDIDQYLAMEARKEAEVVHVRLENIKLKHKLKKKEQQLKSKEELAEGLHLIDFEQLKIENQTYNEKIEERNEDLLKLRKKITSTVQVLTHLKEKLQFVYAENQVLKKKLHEVEDEAAKKRDKLTRTKQVRDHLRIDNHKLRQSCGLLGNEPLLRDFEEQKDESERFYGKIEQLKMYHSELTLSCTGVRKKIEMARLGKV